MTSNNHMHIFKLALCPWIVGKSHIALQTRTRTHKNKISSTQLKNPAQRSRMTYSSWPFFVERAIFNLKCIEIFTAGPHMHHLYLPLPSIWKPFVVEEFPALNNVHSFNFFLLAQRLKNDIKKVGKCNNLIWSNECPGSKEIIPIPLVEITVARNILQTT